LLLLHRSQLVNFAYFVVVPLDEVKESGELIAALFFERVFGEHLGKTILPLAIAISATSNVMVVTFTLVISDDTFSNSLRMWLVSIAALLRRYSPSLQDTQSRYCSLV
jgi:hypothetical protein